MSFGERLQALRRSTGMTQEEFAQQLKVSRQAVSKWESSRGYPEIEKIIYICNQYGVPMSDLFADEAPPAPADEGSRSKKAGAGQILKTRPFKDSFGSFFNNLPPKNQLLLGAVAAVVLLALVILLCTTLSKGETNQVLWKLIWTALLILMAIGEAVTVGLTCIWFAAGSLVALVVSLLDGPLWLQIVLFILVSILCLLAVRPLAKKYLNSKVEPTNADRIIGAESRVIEDIDNLQATGAIRIDGIVWSARSAHDAPIPAGTLVRILRIEGVKVYVEPVKEKVSV